MANTLATLVVEMAADVASLQRDLGRALGEAKKFSSAVKQTLGVGLSAGGFVLFVKGAIDAADRLNDLRSRTGLTGQQLLVMEGAAVRSGAQLETVGDIASKLSRRLEDARKGTGAAANAYAAMGIKVTDASGRLKNQDAILREVGAKFKGYEDGADKAALATAALGKGGDALIPFVEAIEETEQRFRRLGIVIDDDILTAADSFNDKVEDMKSVTGALGRAVASALLPHLNNAVDALLEFQKSADAVKTATDAVIFPLKVMATGFIAIAGTAAAAARIVAGFALAAVQLAKGDFYGAAGAVNEITIGFEEAAQRFEGMTGVLTALWNSQTQGAKKAEDAAKRVRPPGMPDLAEAKKANDALQKLLDARTKIMVDTDKDMTEKSVALLERRYTEGLVSERTYWSERLAIQREGLQSELRTLDTQIARQTAERDKATRNTKEYYDAQRELEETLAKRAKLERDVTQAALLGGFDAAAAMQRYQDKIQTLNADLHELRANTERALGMRQEVSNRDLRQKFMTEGNQAGLELLNTVEKLQRAQAGFNERREEQEQIGSRLQLQEERIQNALRTGAISEFTALQQTSEARRRSATQLEVIVRKLEEVARASENPALQIQAEQARFALERLRTESDLLADKFNTIFKDSFADAFGDFVNGTKTAKEAFASFAQSVLKNINDIIAKNLAQQLFGNLLGGGSGAGGALSSLFGGGDLYTTIGRGMNAIQGPQVAAPVIDLIPSGVPAFADGTDFVPRTGLAMLHAGEAVLTAKENRERGNQIPTIGTLIVQAQGQAGRGFGDTPGQIAAAVTRAQEDLMRRHA